MRIYHQYSEEPPHQ